MAPLGWWEGGESCSSCIPNCHPYVTSCLAVAHCQWAAQTPLTNGEQRRDIVQNRRSPPTRLDFAHESMLSLAGAEGSPDAAGTHTPCTAAHCAGMVQLVICISLVMFVVGSSRAFTLCTIPPPAATSSGPTTVPVMIGFFVTGSTAADDTVSAPLSALRA